jgi:FKBP-type peptidyl-prolyl cis-trans isomerase SlyD
MKIARNTVVTLSYRLTTSDDAANDELLEEATPESPAHYLHGGYDGIFSAVEDRLEGAEAGVSLDMTLPPEDAFGHFEEELVKLEKLENLPEDVELGTQLEAEVGDAIVIYTVTDIAEGVAVLDGNHPLAGRAVRVSLRVEGIRAATAEEIEHGHPHGPEGHAYEH